MSFIGDLLGGGGGGMNFRAESAPILQPASTRQSGELYDAAQSGLYNLGIQMGKIQGNNQNALGNQASVFDQQQALANQLQGVANGTGPNPALQQLQNTTGQNMANQAALMAGQRGASSNVGLLARQAAMQGANIQQQAAGQGAALSAQQQLGAMGALQQQQGMMGNLAGQQIGQNLSANQLYNQALQNEQANILGAIGQYNNANVSMQSNLNSANAGVAGQTAQGQQGLLGGLGNAAGKVAGMFGLKFADGGMVSSYADGGMASGPQSAFGKFLNGFAPSPSQPQQEAPLFSAPPSQPLNWGAQSMSNWFPSSPPPVANSNLGASDLSQGQIQNAARGAVIKGSAPVKGDSIKNDTVPAMLSPKEIVIPRSITMGKNAPEKAKEFVAAVLAKNGMRNSL